jgi:RNA polymerase sigma-70 factor (sigma-E family)
MSVLRGAEAAGFEEFVAGRYPSLVRLGALLTGDHRLGEDLAQEGLLAAYRVWRRIGQPGERPEGYVRQVMVRTAARSRRRRWWGELPTADVPDVAEAGFADQADVSTQVFAVLRALPADQRVVLVLRFWADASEAEIARLLGVPAGTGKSRTSRALAALRASGLLLDASGEGR